ncbi:conjugal transfer protein MobA [Chryseobacterium sp. T20]|uniref:conjugal transfer protein MobA n=1 Tax=Chryseobacterium sp. T20 TaxID=3395375 RepID=UPI0039BD4C5D
MNDKNNEQKKKGGRHPKVDPAKIRYTISLNELEHSRFLELFDHSGMKVKAHFITSCIFNKPIKTVKIDKGSLDFYMRLTSFHSQFRNVGINYNQIVKILYTHFSEKKAASFLYKLEKQTVEMIEIFKNVIKITEEFHQKNLQNNNAE